MEIEISSTPQYELKEQDPDLDSSGQSALQWQGFVMPPTNISAAINIIESVDDEEKGSKQVGKKGTLNLGFGAQYLALDFKRVPTHFGENCKKHMMPTSWTTKSKLFCDECIKFRVYQECVRKFVLEYANDEIRDDLWPWYENNKYHKQNAEYKKVLEDYAEQVLQIDPFGISSKPSLLSRNSSVVEEDIMFDDENNAGVDPNKRSIRRKFQHSSYQACFVSLFVCGLVYSLPFF